MKVQGKIKMQTHRISVVVMDIAAFKVSYSFDMDATALPAARARSSSILIGAMDEMSQKVQNASNHPLGCKKSRARAQQLVRSRVSSRGQAHIIGGVVMDITAFKVSHSVDSDATALRAARARSSYIGAMDEG
jgi:hypothetical protein